MEFQRVGYEDWIWENLEEGRKEWPEENQNILCACAKFPKIIKL